MSSQKKLESITAVFVQLTKKFVAFAGIGRFDAVGTELLIRTAL
jgi:hypothetical protein